MGLTMYGALEDDKKSSFFHTCIFDRFRFHKSAEQKCVTVCFTKSKNVKNG